MSRLRALSALGGVSAGLLLACVSAPAYAGGLPGAFVLFFVLALVVGWGSASGR